MSKNEMKVRKELDIMNSSHAFIIRRDRSSAPSGPSFIEAKIGGILSSVIGTILRRIRDESR